MLWLSYLADKIILQNNVYIVCGVVHIHVYGIAACNIFTVITYKNKTSMCHLLTFINDYLDVPIQNS